MSDAPTVLAVGAAGKFAGLVIPELAKRGVTVRGFVKDDKQVDDVRRLGAAEIAVEFEKPILSQVEPSSLAGRGASWSM